MSNPLGRVQIKHWFEIVESILDFLMNHKRILTHIFYVTFPREFWIFQNFVV